MNYSTTSIQMIYESQHFLTFKTVTSSMYSLTEVGSHIWGKSSLLDLRVNNRFLGWWSCWYLWWWCWCCWCWWFFMCLGWWLVVASALSAAGGLLTLLSGKVVFSFGVGPILLLLLGWMAFASGTLLLFKSHVWDWMSCEKAPFIPHLNLHDGKYYKGNCNLVNL